MGSKVKSPWTIVLTITSYTMLYYIYCLVYKPKNEILFFFSFQMNIFRHMFPWMFEGMEVLILSIKVLENCNILIPISLSGQDGY